LGKFGQAHECATSSNGARKGMRKKLTLTTWKEKKKVADNQELEKGVKKKSYGRKGGYGRRYASIVRGQQRRDERERRDKRGKRKKQHMRGKKKRGKERGG